MLKLSNNKKNLLITGGSGFLGKNILNQIDRKKYNITLLTRRRIKGFRCIVVKDIFNLSTLQFMKILNNKEIVLHLAWYAKPNKYLNSLKNFDCLDGSIRLATACKMVGIKKFIGIGTCLEYVPKKKKLNTSDEIKANSVYSGTKILLYRYCKDLFYKTKTNFIWCRIFYLFGKGEPKQKLVSHVLSQISKNRFVKLSKGSQIKDFIDIKEASNQIIETLKNDKYSGPLNICTGRGLSVKNFIMNFAKNIKKEKYLLFNNKNFNTVDPPYIVGHKTVKI